ncbi:hypothetical protein BJX99DRAFT_233560 [Aspergillus californicus]
MGLVMASALMPALQGRRREAFFEYSVVPNLFIPLNRKLSEPEGMKSYQSHRHMAQRFCLCKYRTNQPSSPAHHKEAMAVSICLLEQISGESPTERRRRSMFECAGSGCFWCIVAIPLS